MASDAYLVFILCFIIFYVAKFVYSHVPVQSYSLGGKLSEEKDIRTLLFPLAALENLLNTTDGKKDSRMYLKRFISGLRKSSTCQALIEKVDYIVEKKSSSLSSSVYKQNAQPLLVIINVKSGGHLGKKLLDALKDILYDIQICYVNEDDPRPYLQLYKILFKKFYVLI